MAKFFGLFDYTTPGPGIPKDQPPKTGRTLFFELLIRKFWDLVKLNLLHFVFNLPSAILLFLGLQFLFPTVIADDPQMDIMVRLATGAMLSCIPLLTTGPAQAGFTYILRNYAREEHAFIWSDYKETAFKNIKESGIVCILDFVFFLILSIALNFYGQLASHYPLALVALIIILLVLILFIMMHLFIYPMMITYQLSVKQIFKNALIFSLIRFFPNLGIILICFLIVLATFLNAFIGAAFYFLISPSLIGLITNIYIRPIFKKYMTDF